jgi:hypothetical protein
MKIIIRDAKLRETESERLFVTSVPEREGRIMVEALNANALPPDRYELVSDTYVLYRFHLHHRDYFEALSRIWEQWFAARKNPSAWGGYSMKARDEDIRHLQEYWRPGETLVSMCRPLNKNIPAPRVKVNLAELNL